MELVVLKDILIIFALSTVVNLVFTKLKVPTIVGYLLTGVVAGPHLLKLIHTESQIELMAEIGVILLLFSIGMEFSLKHLMRIRRVVFLGGFAQVVLTAGAFFVASHFYEMNWKSGLFIGLIAALSSSALVLKVLQERSEITSNYGRTVVGILIFQDLMLVPLLLFTNLLGKGSANISHEILVLGLKATVIIAFVYIGNKWLLPRLLHVIAMSKNQELFMMSILVICLGIALLTSTLGMSLAFGAFLAGLMISDSEYSHNAFGNLVTFKDTFTSFFFVSIGMLLDLNFVAANWHIVMISVVLVLIVKTVIAGGTGFLLGHTFKGTVMIGLALSQVGEFSFLLAKLGMSYQIISGYVYQLFLAVAVLSMALSPFIIRSAPHLADLLLRLPLPGLWVHGLFPLKEVELPDLKNHLVIIGKDTSALKLSVMAHYEKIPYVAIVFDPSLVRDRLKSGETVIYGDAVNEPILRKAQVDSADIVVVSVGDIIPAMAILEKIRALNKQAYIIVRAKQTHDIEHLYALGADQVVPEKLETAIDLFQRVLAKRSLSNREISRIVSDIRNGYYGVFRDKDTQNKPTFIDELHEVAIESITIAEGSQAAERSLIDLRLRNVTGVTVLSLKRGKEHIEHPGPKTVIHAGDVACVMGTAEQIIKAKSLFEEPVV